MKKNYIISLFICFLASFSLTLQGKGMELDLYKKWDNELTETVRVRSEFQLLQYLKELNAMELNLDKELKSKRRNELREIVQKFSQPALYDRDEELKHIVILMKYDETEFSKDYDHHTPNSVFDKLPPELLVKICPMIDDSISLYIRIGLTCRRLYLITHHHFSLTPYCLTETMIHTIPLSTLRTKVRGTKDGLLKVASLYCVSEQDLVEWFGMDMLKDALKETPIQESIPVDFRKDTTDEEFDKLYSLFKIALAAKHQKEEILSLLANLMKLGVFSLSINQLRLCSLYQPRDYDYYFVLFQKLNEDPSSHPDHSPTGVVARDLLLRENYIHQVEKYYVYQYPQKRERSLQLVEWTYQHIPKIYWETTAIDRVFYLYFVMNPKKDLLPVDDCMLSRLIKIFVNFEGDRRVQPQVKEIACSLYFDHWNTISFPNKLSAIKLMLETGNQENALRALGDFLSNSSEEIIEKSASLLYILSEENCSKEVLQILQHLLNPPINLYKLSAIFKNIKLIFEYRNNELLQSQIRKFAATIYPDYWDDLKTFHKARALILMAYTGEGEHIKEAISDFLSGKKKAFPTLLRELNDLLLKNTHIEIDLKKSNAFLRDCIEFNEKKYVNDIDPTTLSALYLLARYDKAEAFFVKTHLEPFLKKMAINPRDHFLVSAIYYELNEEDLGNHHYQLGIKNLHEECKRKLKEKRVLT